MKYEISYEMEINEQRQVGGVITSKDGSNFILSGTFEYYGQMGNLINSGTASIDGNYIFCLISPTVAENFQYVIFYITITPADTTGNIITTANQEKMIEKIWFNVDDPKAI